MVAQNLDASADVTFSSSATLEIFQTTEAPYFSAPDPDGPSAFRADIRFSCEATMLIQATAVPPPSEYVRPVRVSHEWGVPTLSNGRPVGWEPLSETREVWGHIQVVMDGRDVTFYRGIPCQIGSFGSSEPFDDDTCEIFFPQITPFEALPSWMDGEKEVTFYRVLPNDTKTVLWEGFIASDEDSISESEFGVGVACYGALYDADRYLTPPPAHPIDLTDVGNSVLHHLDPTNKDKTGSFGLRTSKCILPEGLSGVVHNRAAASWSRKLSGYIADLLSSCTDDNGDQWTVMKNPGKVPVFRKKDLTTVHWTVVIGQPGLEHDLSRNYTEAPNTFYGEGTWDNCRWRNAVYPRRRPDDAPPWPGALYYPGNTYDSNLQLFKQEIRKKGFNVSDDNVYWSYEEPEIKRFQGSYGGLQSGIIAAQTWAGAFNPGEDAGDLTGGYFQPLVFDDSYPWVKQGSGSADNPNFDKTKLRRDHYINWGSDVHIWQATASSQVLKDRGYPADYIGSLTLSADPQEGHRFEIKAGQNILVKSHHGSDRLFHIARAEVDPEGGTTKLTVDEGGRDALTLVEIIKRNKDFGTPTWKQDRVYRNSRAVEDRYPTWDCEIGAGDVPRHGIFRNLWNVLRIPFAQGGEIVRTEFHLDNPGRFSVAVFDRPMTHAAMRSYGANPLVEDYWDGFGDGLIVSWGGFEQAAGYYPGRESDDDGPTGVLVDDSSWYYESTAAPWLWIAIWSETTNYVRGQFLPGTFD